MNSLVLVINASIYSNRVQYSLFAPLRRNAAIKNIGVGLIPAQESMSVFVYSHYFPHLLYLNKMEPL